MSVLILTLLLAGEPDCARAISQPDLNFCAGADFERADRALNRQWTATLGAMSAAGGTAEGRIGRLRDAQRAWIAFRDAHCESAHYSGVGASLDYTRGILCRTALTEARTRQLAEIAKEL